MPFVKIHARSSVGVPTVGSWIRVGKTELLFNPELSESIRRHRYTRVDVIVDASEGIFGLALLRCENLRGSYKLAEVGDRGLLRLASKRITSTIFDLGRKFGNEIDEGDWVPVGALSPEETPKDYEGQTILVIKVPEISEKR